MDNDFATGYALGSDNNGGGNDGMWGGNGSWIFAFLIIALIFGGNGWGWGNNGGNGAGYQGAVTRSDLCSEFNFNNLSRSVLGIQDGLCNGFYSMNNGMLTGFNTLGSAVSNGSGTLPVFRLRLQHLLRHVRDTFSRGTFPRL